MKLDKIKNLDVERIGELNDSIQAGISKDSLPFVFDIISRQLYSNPIGSIIREITSNCFDSHKEANVDDPVIIRKVYEQDEDQWYIEFEDFGVGLSPERIESVYMNYFSSTKREDNNLIGGFGLGSKTPLAYSDLFYILTRFDNIEYSYVFHKGEDKPTLDILYEEETDKRNGTTIRVPIKSNSNHHTGNDSYLFLQQLQSQLLYFDNVYFEGWNINNNYNIYESNYFKFRSDINQGNQLHICIGKVAYPINFNQIKVSDSTQYLPIAIRFEIGELAVTPSREELRYTDDSKKLIQDRIDKAIDEILEIYNSQNPEVEDLKEFIQLKGSTPKLIFNKEKNHSLLVSFERGKAKYKFAPLSSLNLKRVPNNLLFEYEVVGKISNGNYKEEVYQNIEFIFTNNNKYIIIDSKDRISKYPILYINEIFKGNNIYIIKKKSIHYNEYCKSLGLTDKTLGKFKVILEYSNIIANIIKFKGHSYNDYKPSEQWIKEYKDNIKLESAAFQRRKAKKVFVKDYFYGYGPNEIYEHILANRTGITIYGFREDSVQLQQVANILYCKKSIVDGRNKAAIVIQIAKNVEKIFKNNAKAIHCSEFFKTKLFKKITTAHLLYDEIDFKYFDKYSPYIKQYKDLEDKVQYIREYIKQNKQRYSNVLDIARENNSFIPEVVKLIDELKINNLSLPLLEQISYLEEVESEVIEYLKFKKIRLNNVFYLKPKINEQTIENTHQEENTKESQEGIEESSQETITEVCCKETSYEGNSKESTIIHSEEDREQPNSDFRE